MGPVTGDVGKNNVKTPTRQEMEEQEDHLLRLKAKIGRYSLYAMLTCIILVVIVYLFSLSWVPKEELSETTFAAKVNGKIITLDEVTSWTRFLNSQVQGNKPVTEEETLKQLITYELLLEEAQKKKLSVPESEVNTFYEQYDQMSQYALERILAEQDMRPSEFKDHIRNTLLIQKVFETITKQITVTEDEIATFTRDNQAFIEKQTQGRELTEEQIKNSIEQTLLDIKREEAKNAYIDRLYAKASIRYYNKFLNLE